MPKGEARNSIQTEQQEPKHVGHHVLLCKAISSGLDRQQSSRCPDTERWGHNCWLSPPPHSIHPAALRYNILY